VVGFRSRITLGAPRLARAPSVAAGADEIQTGLFACSFSSHAVAAVASLRAPLPFTHPNKTTAIRDAVDNQYKWVPASPMPQASQQSMQSPPPQQSQQQSQQQQLPSPRSASKPPAPAGAPGASHAMLLPPTQQQGLSPMPTPGRGGGGGGGPMPPPFPAAQFQAMVGSQPASGAPSPVSRQPTQPPAADQPQMVQRSHAPAPGHSSSKPPIIPEEPSIPRHLLAEVGREGCRRVALPLPTPHELGAALASLPPHQLSPPRSTLFSNQHQHQHHPLNLSAAHLSAGVNPLGEPAVWYAAANADAQMASLLHSLARVSLQRLDVGRAFEGVRRTDDPRRPLVALESRERQGAIREEARQQAAQASLADSRKRLSASDRAAAKEAKAQQQLQAQRVQTAAALEKLGLGRRSFHGGFGGAAGRATGPKNVAKRAAALEDAAKVAGGGGGGGGKGAAAAQQQQVQQQPTQQQQQQQRGEDGGGGATGSRSAAHPAAPASAKGLTLQQQLIQARGHRAVDDPGAGDGGAGAGGGALAGFGGGGRGERRQPRDLTVRDLIAVLERDPVYCRSPEVYRLYLELSARVAREEADKAALAAIQAPLAPAPSVGVGSGVAGSGAPLLGAGSSGLGGK